MNLHVWPNYFVMLLYIRLTCASRQTCIHRFLLQIAEYYKEQEKTIDFVYDILKVEVPDLFAVDSQNDEEAVTKFVQELHTFIAQNQLKHKLLSNMKKVLVRNYDVFHYVSKILAVVLPLTSDETDW